MVFRLDKGGSMELCMIGVRGHNGYVFEGLKRRQDIRVVGVSAGTEEDDGTKLVTSCSQFGQSPRLYGDYLKMLDELKPDIVSVAGPFEMHAEISIQAMQRGIHVFCEKPVAISLEELARMRKVHAESRVHLTAMLGMRYDPAFYTAREKVRNGAIGTVRLISTRKSYKLGTRPAYYTQRSSYGGTIPWVGSHSIDWIPWFSGEKFRSVYAAHTTLYNNGLGELEVSAMCHFTLTDDVFASASIDYLRPGNAPTHGDNRIRVAGIDGVIEVREGNVYLINNDTEGEECVPASCSRQILEDFVDQIEGGTEPLLTAEDAFIGAEACLLARQSADECRIVEFGQTD